MGTNDTKQKKSGRKFKKFGGLIFVAFFVVAVFIWNVGLFSRKYEAPVNRTQYPIIYTKDNTLNVMLDNAKKPNVISDYLLAVEGTAESQAYLSKNGENLYFLEGFNDQTDTGALFASFDGKTKLPVSSNAYYQTELSDDGVYLLFAEVPDLSADTCDLYLYKKKGEKRKIAENVRKGHYRFSDDAKSIGYIEANGDFYITPLNGEREKIDSGVTQIQSLHTGDSAAYCKQGDHEQYELYAWQKHAGVSKLADNTANGESIDNGSGNLYYIDRTTNTLYEKKAKKQPKQLDTGALFVMTGYGHSWNIDPDMKYGNFLYAKNYSEQDFTYDIYLKRSGKTPEKIASSSEITDIASSQDFKYIVYLSEFDSGTRQGKLYLRRYGMFQGGEPELLAENVSSFQMTRTGSAISYISDGKLYLYHTKSKKSAVVSEELNHNDYRDNDYYFTANGNALYYIANYTSEKETGNLYMVKTMQKTPKPVKIDSDVSRKNVLPRTERQVLYMKNYDVNTGSGTLMRWNNKKTKEIDHGIIDVMFEE